jgi:hypothetical protein
MPTVPLIRRDGDVGALGRRSDAQLGFSLRRVVRDDLDRGPEVPAPCRFAEMTAP